MEYNQSVIELIRKRRSVRNYKPDSLPDDLEKHIRLVLDQHSTGPMGNHIQFYLVQKNAHVNGGKVRIGTYGFIKGAQYFIVGEVKKQPFAEEDYGYLLEKIMLHMLELGLGTCWLGGTFKRSDFEGIVGGGSRMIIPAITPLGIPANVMSSRERLIRRGAGSDQRKPWEQLFFDEEPGNPLPENPKETYFTPLEMVRLGPSASNKQPWRVIRSGDRFHFFLERTPGYGKFIKETDLQRIDMGIAMAHFEITAQATGLPGNWTVKDPGFTFENDMEYIASFK